ncbi:Protein-arginine kinase activator protein McsA [Propionispira arboris]|jgi:protein arginine kinase activator|uniref:Protein-arginine kinase activator protein McsA n=1 Tax=Propionispira arboris TaxID=84035 RepID=A0A1H6YB00_9FIRM|nr:UvrB/UvrC motif-containing protein [Propionispira arboris]SEJ38473.1 Protein-arginine kinase activator protein McsA [Propionispira arboris]
MLCDDCKKNEACVHITQISSDGKVDRNLCEDCAQKYGKIVFNPDKSFSVNDFLTGMFNSGLKPQLEDTKDTAQDFVCPNCGMTYRDFTHTGKIGCSVCYTKFGKRLEPLLRRIHGSSTHNGKIPKRSGGQLEVKHQIKRLRETLQNHIANEEYEEAAKLRDQIKDLEKAFNEEEQQEKN